MKSSSGDRHEMLLRIKLGDVYARRGRITQARNQYSRALKIARSSPELKEYVKRIKDRYSLV